MPIWDAYPNDYRATEVSIICAATRAGDCVAVVGLSGAGKSNLLGFLAHRVTSPPVRFHLADCNRLTQKTPSAILRLIRQALGEVTPAADELAALDQALAAYFAKQTDILSVLLDLSGLTLGDADQELLNNLRALRDAYKYQLTFVIAARRPLPLHNEFAELILAHTLWLGALSASDAHWSARQFATRQALSWDDALIARLIEFSRGYPSFLRAACEAHAAGAPLAELATHPAVQKRLEEFWHDGPSAEALRQAGLADHPWLTRPADAPFTQTSFTAKEQRLIAYLTAHPNTVCEKDDLIQAVWPEDHAAGRGGRDDSLAQLVRRVREKIEPDPAQPHRLLTVPGRGYRYHAP